jgi:hypothetical protein
MSRTGTNERSNNPGAQRRLGFSPVSPKGRPENQGWDKDYNFGSKEMVMPRWQAAVRAHPDFISTDQMEDVACPRINWTDRCLGCTPSIGVHLRSSAAYSFSGSAE